MKDHSGPADTVMMGVMHDALRRDFTRARDVLTTPEVLVRSQTLALVEHVEFMLAFLEGHHHSEDETLWPLVLTHNPSLGPLMEAMSQDHAVIAVQVAQLTDATRQFGSAPDATSRAGLVAALDQLTAVLGPHLDREETELMPDVSTTLSAAQWHEFEKSAKPPFGTRVLAEYLNWFLEDLDQVRRRKVLKGLPTPVVLVSTGVYGRAYRRRAAVRWGTAQSAGPQAGLQNRAMRRAMRAANTTAVWLYRKTGGRIGGTAKGTDVLLLTVTGRKSGKPFTVPVAYFTHGADYVVSGSAGGMKHNPQWIRNLTASGQADVEIGRERLVVDGRVTSGTERDTLWTDVVLAQAPFFTKYEQKSGRVIPIATLTPRR